MARLERFRGHLFNWYDTLTLAPLAPLYVSTVDSGNLVGLLITLRAGVAELGHAPVLPPSALEGLLDTVRELGAAVESTRLDQDESSYVSPAIEARITALEALLVRPAPTFAERHAVLAACMGEVALIAGDLRSNPDPEVWWWAQALELAFHDLTDHVDELLGWWSGAPRDRAFWDPVSAAGPDEAAAVLAALERCDTEAPSPIGIRELHADLLPPIDDLLARLMASGAEARRRHGPDGAPGAAPHRRRGRGPAAEPLRAGRGALDRVHRDRVRLPLRLDARPARDRVQRLRAPAGHLVLRPARLGGPPHLVHRDRGRRICRRPTGSRSAASSPPARAGRSSSRGPGRCSST